MMFNMFWFVIAFAIALVLSFGSLGDNTTAHSLALGLGLVWLPALVFMTIVDRNPVSPTRCRVSESISAGRLSNSVPTHDLSEIQG